MIQAAACAYLLIGIGCALKMLDEDTTGTGIAASIVVALTWPIKLLIKIGRHI